MSAKVQAKIISSLEKIFLDGSLPASQYASASALRGERLSFQIACSTQGNEESLRVKAIAKSELTDDIKIFEVGQIPVAHPTMQDYDAGYLRTSPGLYPDPLFNHVGKWSVVVNQWRCLFVTVTVPTDAKPGDYPITVKLVREENEEFICEAEFLLTVIAASLPEQTLIHTEWFHADCISSYYNVPVFSEEHWALLKNYMENAAKYGVNLLLTPVFTPPLDTAVGGERPTVQLVDVERRDGIFYFEFSKLDRYMELAESCGIHRFEISHLFTQWGAAAAPKIMVTENGEEKKLFGWHTDSASTEYGEFLRQFLRKLKKHLRDNDRLKNCWFHLSDEPNNDEKESYEKASKNLGGELDDCRVIDALSEYSFYEMGMVKHPVPAIDVLENFLEKGFSHPWTYYCSGQRIGVSNRFVAMPSARNRIIGSQFYKFGIEGFLHWGFNFWFSNLSRELIDPFTETGAGDAFPAGDAYLVYPGKDGKPLESIREIIIFEALQDMRAMQLLETLTDKETVLKIIDPDGKLGFTDYSMNGDDLLKVRNEINKRIAESL